MSVYNEVFNIEYPASDLSRDPLDNTPDSASNAQSYRPGIEYIERCVAWSTKDYDQLVSPLKGDGTS